MPLLLALVTFYQGFLASKGSSWPDGTYGLPQPISGCPGDVTWKSGWRRQYLKTRLGVNISYPSHLNASLLKNSTGIMRSFCIKTKVTDGANGNNTWPAGKYCIYKYGETCPTGMKTDYFHWNDSKKDKNGHGGILPKGKYGDDDTTIEYCCQNNGDWDKPIELPVFKPFYLLPYKLAICQHIKWAESSIERIVFSAENDKLKPVNNVYMKKTHSSITTYYCYYKACRWTLTTTTGWFTSNYTSDQYCSWTVVLEKNLLISLKFSMLKIPDCTVNYLDIYDGLNENGRLLRRFCGSNNNNSKAVTVNSTGNALFVMLKSGGNFDGASIKQVAFKAEYKSMVNAKDITNITAPSVDHPALVKPSDNNVMLKKPNKSDDLSIITVVTISIAAFIIILVVIVFIIYKRRLPRSAPIICFRREKTRKESDNPIYERSEVLQTDSRNNPLYSSTSGATYEELPLDKTFLPIVHKSQRVQFNKKSDVVNERHLYEQPRV